MRKVLFALLLLLSSCVQEDFLDNKEGMEYLLITISFFLETSTRKSCTHHHRKWIINQIRRFEC